MLSDTHFIKQPPVSVLIFQTTLSGRYFIMPVLQMSWSIREVKGPIRDISAKNWWHWRSNLSLADSQTPLAHLPSWSGPLCSRGAFPTPGLPEPLLQSRALVIGGEGDPEPKSFPLQPRQRTQQPLRLITAPGIPACLGCGSSASR